MDTGVVYLDSLAYWGRMQVLISSIFTITGSLILIPWRLRSKTVLRIAFVSLFPVLGFSIYYYFFTSYNLALYWCLLVVLLVIISIVFARYRDGRTFFAIVTVLGFSVSASIISISCTYTVDTLIIRFVIAILVYSIYIFCLQYFIKTTFHLMAQIFSKGWLVASLIPALPLLSLLLLASIPMPLNRNPYGIPAASVVSLMVLINYIVIFDLLKRIIKHRQLERSYETMNLQVSNMQNQFEEVSARDKKYAILRHDLRHYSTVIHSCIKDGLYAEAEKGLSDLLSQLDAQESYEKYCNNPTINSLISYFAEKAQKENINFQTRIELDVIDHIDTMEFAVLLSNIIENAFNACQKQNQEMTRSIKVKIKHAGEQLFINISNTCPYPVKIDEETGLPVPEKEMAGHGIGFVSIVTFVDKYNAHINCIQDNDWFRLRIVI